jgi:phosphoglycerate dehydrogenase-like enzyme
MALDVFLPRPPGGGFLEDLEARLDPEVRLTTETPESCPFLVEGRPSAEQIEGREAVIIPYAGVPRPTLELMRKHPGIALHNLHHNAAPTAELAVALLLAAAKRIVPIDRALRSGDWRPRYVETRAFLCEGKTALVLGHGAIGRRVADACRALGMTVLAVRRRPSTEEYGPEDLRNLLPRADALIICLPWTEETDGLLGAPELARLPEGALLVNVARGPVVDAEALFLALREGHLAAGLDVWYRYPENEDARARTFPANQPFHELDNVVLSPHRAGHAQETEALRARHLAAMLNAAARGETMPHRVDLEAGY